MFNIGLGKHPVKVSNIFKKSTNYDRSLGYILNKVNFSYLKQQVPHTLVKAWNELNLADKNWLKLWPEVANKKLSAAPTRVDPGNNFFYCKFRMNNFKKSLLQQTLVSYKKVVKCNNKFCGDCK